MTASDHHLDRVATAAAAMADRDPAINDAYRAGYTLTAIANAAGITRQGVAKIVGRTAALAEIEEATRERIEQGDEIRMLHNQVHFVARYQRPNHNWLCHKELDNGKIVGKLWLADDDQVAAEVRKRAQRGWLPGY